MTEWQTEGYSFVFCKEQKGITTKTKWSFGCHDYPLKENTNLYSSTAFYFISPEESIILSSKSKNLGQIEKKVQIYTFKLGCLMLTDSRINAFVFKTPHYSYFPQSIQISINRISKTCWDFPVFYKNRPIILQYKVYSRKSTWNSVVSWRKEKNKTEVVSPV